MLGAMTRRQFSAFDPTVLDQFRSLPDGREPNHGAMVAWQGWVKHHPERASEALDVVERHLPHWTTLNQITAGIMLFSKGETVRDRFIAALGEVQGGSPAPWNIWWHCPGMKTVSTRR